MEVRFEGNTAFESVSQVIFDKRWDLKDSHRLYLQTWFVRLGIARTDCYLQLIQELLDYVRAGVPSEDLLHLTAEHPHFISWFGKPLVGNTNIEQILICISEIGPFDSQTSTPVFVEEAKYNLESLDLANTLEKIVGEPYPKPGEPLHYVLSEFPSHAYNVYPDSIVHFTKDNFNWYIASFGHEAGHLLTWDICQDTNVRNLCKTDITRNFAERIAELCAKLLLDVYGISCHQAFPECKDWNEYMYEQNPGKPLFDAMVSEIQLGSLTNFRSECLHVLRRFCKS